MESNSIADEHGMYECLIVNSFINDDYSVVCMFADLSQHIVKDNEGVQALISKGNEYRYDLKWTALYPVINNQ